PPPPALRGLVPPAPAAVAEGGVPELDLTAVAPEDRAAVVLDVVRGQVAAVVGIAAAEVDPARPFRDIGFDSLTAVDLRNRLAAATALRLPATLVFDNPTPGELAATLLAQLSVSTPTPADAVVTGLDRLLDDVAALDLDDRARSEARSRAARLLSFLNEPTGVDGGRSTENLADASEEEVLAFVDRELGISLG
ncbi:phosphopantetheine-binding protein, partial [Frankia sp. R82]|uniref:phosphopantetheine-binding protein n=1 Tax=Frankia sp. R82 TaxID=2950553 RepID=UPI00204395D9